MPDKFKEAVDILCGNKPSNINESTIGAAAVVSEEGVVIAFSDSASLSNWLSDDGMALEGMIEVMDIITVEEAKRRYGDGYSD